MNINCLIRRLLQKATCQLANGAKLTASAHIYNARGHDKYICIGENSLISGELFVFAHGGQIELGNWCFVGEGSRIWSASKIQIGDRVLISHNVNIFDSLTHPLNAAQRHNHFKAIVCTGHPHKINLGERPVFIGDDAWIGANACILRGVNIGKGAIVGAGAIVARDVPDGCTVVGNPARIIRTSDACTNRDYEK